MALFKSRKKNAVIDLGEVHRKKQEAEELNISKSLSQEEKPIPFADMFFEQNQKSDEEPVELLGTLHDRKKKLAKRILDMTSKMEDLSNQIYHIQQRIEVL